MSISIQILRIKNLSLTNVYHLTRTFNNGGSNTEKGLSLYFFLITNVLQKCGSKSLKNRLLPLPMKKDLIAVSFQVALNSTRGREVRELGQYDFFSWIKLSVTSCNKYENLVGISIKSSISPRSKVYFMM